MLRTARLLLCLFATVSLGACDTGRADLDEDEEDNGGGGGIMTLEGDCAALIDGEDFEARTASARLTEINRLQLDITCDGGATDLIFRVQPNSVGVQTIALGVLSNQVQLSVGNEVTVSEVSAGTLTFASFTRERIVGTFSVDLPSFDDDGTSIRIRNGQFDIELP